MKKTYKINEALAFIDNLDMTQDEADRLLDEISMMKFRKEVSEVEDPMSEVERENCENLYR
jgi:hypothetical protein